MDDCVFCQIAQGKIPAEVVYQDEQVICFQDLNPRAPVHLLVIPREHLVSLNAADEKHRSLLGQILLVAKQVARETGIDGDGYRLVTNCGRNGGQEVPHLHFHLLGGKPLKGFCG